MPFGEHVRRRLRARAQLLHPHVQRQCILQVEHAPAPCAATSAVGALAVAVVGADFTNLHFKEWGKLFHNAAAASAIADRLVHNGILVRIAGKSGRPPKDQEPDE